MTSSLTASFHRFKYSYLLMAGHTCSDLNQGALIAILPFLVVYNGFSYTEVTLLVFASNILSAIVQPLFGRLGDKRACPWLMAVGIFLAGFGISLTGFLTSYAEIVAAVVVSGIGVAMFHPEGGRVANLVAGDEKARGMSIFAVGGKLGFTIGPLLIACFVGLFGMRGTVVCVVPSVIMAIILLCYSSKFASFGLSDPKQTKGGTAPDRWGAFFLVLGVNSTRAVLYYALLTFIPLFLIYLMGQTEEFGSLMISAYAVMAAVATLVSGRIAQRLGVHRLMRCAFSALIVVVLLFTICRVLPLSVLLILIMALLVDVSYPSAVALGQSFVPNHLGMASGLSFGLAVCIGGIVEPLLGVAGDAWGLEPVLFIVAGIAALGAVLAFAVPKQDDRPF